MTTSNKTLEIGCFYPVKGEVMKFIGWKADETKTQYLFKSWRGLVYILNATTQLKQKRHSSLRWQIGCKSVAVRMAQDFARANKSTQSLVAKLQTLQSLTTTTKTKKQHKRGNRLLNERLRL